MTRDEQIKQKAISEQRVLMESSDWRAGFIAGAKWTDKTIIDKACDWLEKNNKMCMYELEMILGGNFIKDFKKAMEL